MKINFLKTGNVERIKEEAVEFRKEYELVKKIYAEMPGIVPDEATMVSKDPQSGKPRIATIQKFNGCDIRDFIEDFDHDELIDLLINNPELYKEAKKFFEITEREHASQGFIIDLLGKKNLSIVKEGQNNYRLLILDPHNSVWENNEKDIRHERQEIKLLKIKRVLEKVEKLKKDRNISM